MNIKESTHQILTFVRESLKKFESNESAIGCVGLYSSPINGWLSVNIDSSKNETASYNCPDFEFTEYEFWGLPSWEENADLDDSTWQYNDEVLNWDGENEALNEFVFEYLKSDVIIELSQEVSFPILLQMLDSSFIGLYNAGE